jgi:hypothetical protein
VVVDSPAPVVSPGPPIVTLPVVVPSPLEEDEEESVVVVGLPVVVVVVVRSPPVVGTIVVVGSRLPIPLSPPLLLSLSVSWAGVAGLQAVMTTSVSADESCLMRFNLGINL